MAIQPLQVGMPGRVSDFAQWHATAIIDLLRHAATSTAGKTGEQDIRTGDAPEDLPHEALIAQIASGQDRQAFKVLFAHFAPRLKTYLGNLGLSSERAEDLAQDTMVTLWRKAGLYRPEKARASTWIFQIARNKFIDHMRRQKYPEVEVDEYANKLVASEETDAPVLQERVTDRVSAALGQLNPAQRDVIELSFYEELSHSQIAERLSLPLGTVKSRIRIAFEVLRKELGEYR